MIEAVEDCIHVEAVLSIDEMWAWLPFNWREPATVEAVGRKIKAAVARDVSPVIKVSIGAGPNRYLAKIASKMRKPDGLFIIRPGELPGVLFELGLRDFTGIGRSMEARLHASGIHTTEDLCRARKEALHGAWGGVMAAPQVMAWTPTNVFNGGTITVRAGDSLRLTAYPATGSPDGGTVSITGAGDDIATTANAPVVRTFTLPPDWALASNGSTATQSGTGYNAPASRAIDGNTNGVFNSGSVTHTTNAQNSWWQVDFGRTRDVGRIVLWNRTDTGTGVRLSNFHVAVLDANGVEVIGQDFFPTGNAGTTLEWDLPQTVRAKRVRVSLNGLNNLGDGYLSLAEVQVFPNNPYVLNASYTDVNGVSSTGTMTVNVVAPDFGPTFEVRQDRWRTWTLAGIPAGLQFQADHNLQVAETTVAGQTGRTLNVSATTAGTMRVLARTTPGGSVAACGTVKSYVVGDVYDTGYIEVLETLADGTVRGRITVTADQLPPGGYVELDIWAGGALFSNGDNILRLHASDFGADGTALIDVYYPSAGAVSSFCHYTRLYDGSGRLLSSY